MTSLSYKLPATLLMCAFLFASSQAKANFDPGAGEPPAGQAQYSETVNVMLSVDTGWIYDHISGTYLTLEQAQAKVLPGVVVGIIIGAAGSAGAHVASNITSGNQTTLRGVLQSAFFGGMSGVYGAVAVATTGALRVMYGALAVGAQSVPIGTSAASMTQTGPAGQVGPGILCDVTQCVVQRPATHL
jgi:hypothetical protein